MNYKEAIQNYIPVNEQERIDKEVMLSFIKDFPVKCLSRNNKYGHFSASAWVVNPDFSKVLLNFHNIYKNWGWLGGHVDEEEDFLAVAKREVMEESGLKNIKPLSENPISIEILPVSYHLKKNQFVNSHLHLNVTYLFMADDEAELIIKPDENSGLLWAPLEDAISLTNEECMKPIYEKLNIAVMKYKNSL